MRERRPDRKLWTDAEVEQLKTLATTTDLSASQIAAMLGGGFSRLAVIGKCSRLNLKLGQNRPETSVFERKARVELPLVAPTKSERPVRVRVARRRPIVSSLTMLRPAPAEQAEASAAAYHASPARRKAFDPAFAPVGARLVGLVDLDTGECRWPLYEDGPILFCGCKVTTFDRHGQKDVYCTAHLALRDARVLQ